MPTTRPAPWWRSCRSKQAAIGHAIACGKALLKVKAKVGHGGWEELFGGANPRFRESENRGFDFKLSQALRYMKVAAFPALGRQAVLKDGSERFACKIRLRAERKLGEELLKTEKAKGNQHVNSKSARYHGDTEQPPTLSEIGITKSQSSRWQKAAEVPEEEFEEYIQETKKRDRHGDLAC